jgi:hypothetical protein
LVLFFCLVVSCFRIDLNTKMHSSTDTTYPGKKGHQVNFIRWLVGKKFSQNESTGFRACHEAALSQLALFFDSTLEACMPSGKR